MDPLFPGASPGRSARTGPGLLAISGASALEKPLERFRSVIVEFPALAYLHLPAYIQTNLQAYDHGGYNDDPTTHASFLCPAQNHLFLQFYRI